MSSEEEGTFVPTVNEAAAAPRLDSRPYLLICWLSLAAVLLALMQQGIGPGAIPVLLGGAYAVLRRWNGGPIFFLLLIAAVLLFEPDWVTTRYRGFDAIADRAQRSLRVRWLDTPDVLLCVGVLGFVSAHYRLQGIWHNVLSPDPRRELPSQHNFLPRLRRKKSGPPAPAVDDLGAGKRPADLVSRGEVSLFALSVPGWALAAQSLILVLPMNWPILELPRWLCRILLVLWVLGLGTFVVTSLLDVWLFRGMNKRSAWIYLQDAIWRETRGEQRRVNRWLAWWNRP
jgi:hypothetical protein